ncbi:MAG: hydantoinase B/oxoprolinase family protein, partial [Actinobacteria bacterium]|nr:hydantoinase B/oxoprolinase family protein [Actinomycetota bacterium]
GERELDELVGRYGVDLWRSAVEEILDATELLVRRFIEEIPDGVYEASTIVYDDAFDHDAEMVIRLRIEVRGNRMTCDFTGTALQTRGYVNAPLPVTLSSVLIALLMITGGDIPRNDAVLRCVDIVAPEGTMLNPRFPAATGFGNHLSDQICTIVMEALAPVLPERVTAGWNRLLATIVTGRDPRDGNDYVDILVNASKGGGGATSGADGYDHIGLIASGGALAAQDPEIFEALNPCRLRKFEYLCDSGGAGRWRGGLGTDTEIELLGEAMHASVFGDGILPGSEARGLLGGGDGVRNHAELRYPDGQVRVLRGKELVEAIPAGTVYRQLAGGGGGFGDPRERPRELVREELEEGLISPAAAETDYGLGRGASGGRVVR